MADMSKFKEHYLNTVVSSMQKEFGYSSVMAVPSIRKVVLNMGLGEAVTDKKVIERAMDDMQKISGQCPVITRARKSVSNFKVREGWPVGCKVTLRSNRMYDFLERLVCIAIPRIRDFRGLSLKSFDGRGNYSFGIQEQIIFTEIDYDKIDTIRGMDVCIHTTAQTDAEARALLLAFQFPLRQG